MNDLRPAAESPVGSDRSVVVTRAGSQANRYSIELGEAIQALVRATECEPAIPASELLVVFGHLHGAGYGLAQALQQLGTCLRRSIEQGVYWASGEDVDPVEVAAAHLSVAEADASVSAASRRAAQCGELLGRAQRQLVTEARAVEARLGRYYARVPDTAVEADPSDLDAEWVTVEEAAELVGVAVTTITNPDWRRRAGNGLVAHRTPTTRVKFRRDDVLALRELRRHRAA